MRPVGLENREREEVPENTVLVMKKRAKIIKVENLKTPILYFLYVFIVWTFYRMNFKYPDVLEELVIKPGIWLLPLLIYVFPKEKTDLAGIGITLKNIFPSIYLSLALGVGFFFLGLIANIAKYQGVSFGANIGTISFIPAILVSFATAVTEELVFRGYLLGVFMKKYKNLFAVILTTLLWTLIHAPIAYFVWRMDVVQISIYLILTFVYGLGASGLFIRTRNLAAPIFLHVLWEWPIILFR